MPEPIEEIFVRLGMDTSEFVDAYEQAFDKALVAASDSSTEMGQAFAEGMTEAMGGNLTEIGQIVSEMASALSISMEDAAASIDAMTDSSGLAEEQLAALGRQYNTDLLNEWNKTVVQAQEEIETQGRVSQGTAEALAALADALERAAGSNEALALASSRANDMMTNLLRTTQNINTGGNQLGLVTQGIGTLGKVLGGGAQQAAGFANQLLGMATAAAPAVAAIAAVGIAAKEFYDFMNEAVGAAVEFSVINARMGASVRANQRAMGEAAGSVREWTDFADELTSRLGANQTEIYRLITTVNALAPALGFSKDEMMGLANAAGNLSVVTGQDANTALRQMLYYIQYGFPRALRALQVTITPAILDQKAYALGLGNTYKALTDNQKQLVRQAALMDAVATKTGDVAAVQGTMYEKTKQANEAFHTMKTLLGDIIGPRITEMKVAFTAFLTKVVGGMVKTLGLIKLIDINLQAVWAGAIAGVGEFIKVFSASWQHLAAAFDAAKLGDFAGAAKEAKAALAEISTADEAATKRQAEVRKETIDRLAREWSESLGNMGDDFGEAASEADQWAAQTEAAFASVSDAIDALVKEYEKAAKEIESNFYDKMDELDRDFNKSVVGASKDVSRDLTKIDQDAAEKRASVIRDAQVEELRMREDHQRRIRDMESRYLLDLEDAVRERDARQVLMLMRRHNLEVDAEDETYRTAERRRREDFQRQIVEIERERQMRRAERMAEYRQEVADLTARAAEKREQARADRKKALDELLADQAQAIQDIIDEMLATAPLPAEILDGLAKQLNTLAVTSNGALANLASSAAAYVKTIYATVQAAANMSANAGRMMQVAPGVWARGLGAGPSQSAGNIISGRVAGHTYAERGYQTGGEFVATSPQLIRVGERPEHVAVTPLTGQGGPMPGFGAKGGGGRVRVEVSLGGGLVGEIVDGAMSDIAEVVLNMAQADASGFGGHTRVGGRQ